MVDKRKLEVDRAVKVVKEFAPVLENGALVLVLGQLVVDVIKADSLGIEPVLDPADPVAAHLLVGNGLLRGKSVVLLFTA